ncbi:hypothetical protein DSCA_07110 [Desulfosarcina alkanivorans]|uniref:SAF domain-containing protein n=1 Tax=Desulfosarcina alkanivorans TaxID=571177 RepID=A0A5K7YJ65_9BACT|nr:flagellar basal body P-ring formation chaperone FlgA [Desulfosarcina alkanivorans]BBO66781.1 hypothetical protein DSCA_07110 [Desulfosarcina alkanivorans]
MMTDDIQGFQPMDTLRRYLFFILAALLSAPAAVYAGTTGLTLKAAVVVDREAVRLSDIAAVTDGPTTPLKTVGDIVVAKSPPPGQTRFVGVDYIRIRLKQAGVDTAAMVFNGPRDVRITREAAALPVGRIARAVEAAIRSRMPWKDEDVAISGIRFDESIQLPTGKLAYRLVPDRDEDYMGRTTLDLHLFVDGEPVRRIKVQATIAVMADVVSVVRPLGKHQHIRRADLAVERRDLAGLPATVVTRIDDALGNRVTRMVYPNTVLQSTMIARPPLVKRGDVVKIVARTGLMTITATGMVKQKGCRGEMIRVMNTDSNRIVMARVTGPGAVEVDF